MKVCNGFATNMMERLERGGGGNSLVSTLILFTADYVCVVWIFSMLEISSQGLQFELFYQGV